MMNRGFYILMSLLNYVAIGVLTYVLLPNKLAVGIMLVIGCSVSLFLGYCLRCRHCGTWFRKGMLFADYCPSCGKSLY